MTCEVKFCRDKSVMSYYGRSICEKHWIMNCKENNGFSLKDHFGIQDQQVREDPQKTLKEFS